MGRYVCWSTLAAAGATGGAPVAGTPADGHAGYRSGWARRKAQSTTSSSMVGSGSRRSRLRFTRSSSRICTCRVRRNNRGGEKTRRAPGLRTHDAAAPPHLRALGMARTDAGGGTSPAQNRAGCSWLQRRAHLSHQLVPGQDVACCRRARLIKDGQHIAHASTCKEFAHHRDGACFDQLVGRQGTHFDTQLFWEPNRSHE